MGKKSLTKSTTKKKTAATKKSEPTKKIDTAQKSAPVKKQVAAPTAKPAASPKKAKASTPKKPTIIEKPTIATLIQKEFAYWSPQYKFMPQPDPVYLKNFSAPTFIDETNPTQANRIRTLLAKEFDLTVPDAPEKTTIEPTPDAKVAAMEMVEPTEIKEKPAAPEKREPIPLSELLNIKFEDWLPAAPFSPVPDENYLKNFTAPPFIETSDPKEAERVKALLFKTIDLTVIEIKETPAPEKIKPPAEAKPPVVETPQPTAAPEIKKPAPESVQVKEEATQSPKAEIKKETETFKPLAWTETKKPAQTFDSGLKLLTGCIAVFFALLVLASGINAGKYYLMPSESGLEIWKGKFSPSGKKLMMTVPGVELKEPLKHSYTKEEALAPAFNNYLRQADELSAAKGTPDFEAIKNQLKNAVDVAPTDTDRDMAVKRLSAIDFTFLLYKANSASRKKTPENIEKALSFLNEARALDLDNAQQETLEKKINELNPPVTPENPREAQKPQISPENKSGKH